MIRPDDKGGSPFHASNLHSELNYLISTYLQPKQVAGYPDLESKEPGFNPMIIYAKVRCYSVHTLSFLFMRDRGLIAVPKLFLNL